MLLREKIPHYSFTVSDQLSSIVLEMTVNAVLSHFGKTTFLSSRSAEWNNIL